MKCTAAVCWLIKSDQIMACLHLNSNWFRRMWSQRCRCQRLCHRSGAVTNIPIIIDNNAVRIHWNGFCGVSGQASLPKSHLRRFNNRFSLSQVRCVAAVVHIRTKTMNTILVSHNPAIKTAVCSAITSFRPPQNSCEFIGGTLYAYTACHERSDDQTFCLMWRHIPAVTVFRARTLLCGSGRTKEQ